LRQLGDPTGLASVEPLGNSDLGDGPVLASVQQLLPVVREAARTSGVSSAAKRPRGSAAASTRNVCGASMGVTTCRFTPRLTSVQGMKVSMRTPPAGLEVW
jgi:hypothetical protein